jgi:hypothetical protein
MTHQGLNGLSRPKYYASIFACAVAFCSPYHANAVNIGAAINGETYVMGSFLTLQPTASTMRGLSTAKVFVGTNAPCGPVAKAPAGTCGPALAVDAGGDATGFTNASGNTFARSTQTISGPTPPGRSLFFVNTAGTQAVVTAGGPFGVASVGVFDPAVYSGASGQTFDLAYGLTSAFGLQALLNEPGLARSTVSTRAGRNIAGLETLFPWSATLDGSDPTSLHLLFLSNPLLGLDDAAIINSIRSSLVFDPAAANYGVNSDFNYASFSVTVPIGQDIAEFSWNTTGEAEAAVVPEPGDAAPPRL